MPLIDKEDRGQSGALDAPPQSNERANTHPSLQPPPLPETYPFDDAGALCREYLLERGYCCALGCRNCPYKEDLFPALA